MVFSYFCSNEDTSKLVFIFSETSKSFLAKGETDKVSKIAQKFAQVQAKETSASLTAAPNLAESVSGFRFCHFCHSGGSSFWGSLLNISDLAVLQKQHPKHEVRSSTFPVLSSDACFKVGPLNN